MSTVAATGAATGVNVLTREEAQAAQEMTNQDFLRLLIAQVQHQNPLEPMKNHEMMAQMTQIKSLEATTALTEQLNKLGEQSQLGAAAGMLGKLIRGFSAGGGEVAGRVERVLVEKGVVNLVVGERKVPYDNVVEVAEAAAETEETQADGE